MDRALIESTDVNFHNLLMESPNIIQYQNRVMGQAALHVTAAPCRLKHFVAYVAKDRLLAFPLSEVARLIPLKASHSHRSHSGSREPMSGFVQMPNLPLPHFLHSSHPT